MKNNFKEFFKVFKIIDKNIFNVIIKGNKVSFFICILAVLILVIYNIFYISLNLIDASIILFKTGLMFALTFYVFGVITNKIKQDMLN